MISDNYRIVGKARDAGRNVVHTVEVDGEVVATRRSAHRYSFAIAHWSRNRETGEARIIVERWSRNPKATGSSFAIRIVDAS